MKLFVCFYVIISAACFFCFQFNFHRDIDMLQEEMARKNSIMVNLTQRVEELTSDLTHLRTEHALCEPKILELEESISRLSKELKVAQTPKGMVCLLNHKCAYVMTSMGEHSARCKR